MIRKSVIAGGALCLLGCGGDEAPPNGEPSETDRYGGTAVVAFLAEASSLNQFASVDENSLELQTHVLFTTLIRYDEDLAPVPYLAESWDTAAADDGLALTFNLRDDVRWHDGQPTTAYDVKFTFDRIKNPDTAYPRASLLALYDSAVVNDSLSVTFYLERHPCLFEPWRTIAPMPEHLLGEVPPDELRSHPFGTESPLGNGPFRFVEHRSGDRWVFEANPDFPAALGGRPYLDRLVYRVIEEPTTRLSELLTGAVDVYLLVDPFQIAEIEADPRTRIISYATRNYVFINWNGRRPLFRDARVRRALTMGIDRARMVEAVRGGFGTVATGPIPPFHWAHHDGLEPLPYDPDSARALLDAAGWIDRDGDGVRERDGREARFDLRTNPNPTREDIMTLVQDDLAKIGVQVQPRVQEAQSLRRDITAPDRPFDAFVLGWAADFCPDDRALFACSQMDGPFQWASYCNPRVDSLLEQLAVLPDRSVARALWYEYQETIRRDQPYTFIYYELRPNAVRARVRDVEMDIRGQLINVHRWWIDPEHRR